MGFSPRKQAGTQQQEAHQQQKQQREKMCGPPCFRSVCGMPLQKAVYIIGLIELIITVIVTIANVVKYSQFVNEEDCEGKDVCIGPIIKYCVFDTAVTLVVVAFTKECGTTSGGVVHDYGAPPAYKAWGDLLQSLLPFANHTCL